MQSTVSCIALNEKNNLIVYGQEVQIHFIIINFQNFFLQKKGGMISGGSISREQSISHSNTIIYMISELRPWGHKS